MNFSSFTHLFILSACLIAGSCARADTNAARVGLTIRLLDPYGKAHSGVAIEGYVSRRERIKGTFFDDFKHHVEEFKCTSDHSGECKVDAPIHSGDHVEGHIRKIGLPTIADPLTRIYVPLKNPRSTDVLLTLFVDGGKVRARTNLPTTTAVQVEKALAPVTGALSHLVVFDTSSVHSLWLQEARGPFEQWVSVRAVGDRNTRKWTFHVLATTVEEGPFNSFDGVMALAGKQTTRDITYAIKGKNFSTKARTYRRLDNTSVDRNLEAAEAEIPERHLRTAIESYSEGTAAALIFKFDGRKFIHHMPLHLFEIDGLLRKVDQYEFE